VEKRKDERKRRETFFSIHRWRKALKGKAQECWELKEAPRDLGANILERVAKP
jgi:hypothetical protein